MRAFLGISALFIAAGAGITFFAPNQDFVLETWLMVAVVIVFLGAWTFIGRKKK